jgi:hypothetical protein
VGFFMTFPSVLTCPPEAFLHPLARQT